MLVFLTASTSTAGSAGAIAVSGWQAGRIIDDVVFTNVSTMGVNGIQTFLNSKVPACDSSGTKLSEYGAGDANKDGKSNTSDDITLVDSNKNGVIQRWEWGKYYFNQTYFTCLKDYLENGKTAAEIIYSAAQEFSINPQVLIVLLQKEQGLVTDEWPLNVQYKSAAGYGCPDNAPCDSQYFGLTNQLRWAARMFRSIMSASPTWYTPYVLGNNYIQYNPNTNCGGTTVNILNRSTQALYNYTPYQPNVYALGGGTSSEYPECGSFGNLNFYYYFTNWFGSVSAVNGSIVISNALTTSQQIIRRGDTINAWFEIKNTADVEVNVGGLGVCARLNGKNYDFGFSHQNKIAPNGRLVFTYNKSIDESGSLTLFICSYNEAVGGWASSFYPYNTSGLNRSLTFSVADNPTITTGLALSQVSPVSGQITTATFTIRNDSNTAINIGSLTVAGRSPTGSNVDFPVVNDVIVPAGGEYTYNQSRSFSQPGSNYRFFIANWNGVWSTTYPGSASDGIVRALAIRVR